MVCQSNNGSDTDAHIDAVLLNAGVSHTCTAHMEAEHTVSGHIRTYISTGMLSKCSDVWLNKADGGEHALGFMRPLKMFSFECAAEKLAGQMHMDDSSAWKNVLWHCCIVLEATDGP